MSLDIAKFAVFVLALTLANLKFAKAAITSDGCGKTKTCFRNPEGCDLSAADCRFFSWTPADEEGVYIFEMSGGGISVDKPYVALAFASESQMSDADLYYCDGTAVRTGTIQIQYQPPVYNEMKDGLNSKSAALVDGIVQCSFTRPASIVKTISNGVKKNFDITKNEYYLLAAVGPMLNSTAVARHYWTYASDSTYNFAASPQLGQFEQETHLRSTKINTVLPIDFSEQGHLPTITSDECGVTKSCASFPNSCAVGTAGCFFYSWAKQSDGSFTFEIVGGGGYGEGYAAIALGTQSLMTDADLYYCDGVTVRSGVIRDLGVEPAYVTTSGMSTISAKTINGIAHCEFKRPASVAREISGGMEKIFDLNSESYFLLAASGMMNGEKVQHHTWTANTENKIISSKVNSPILSRGKFFATVEEENEYFSWL